MSSSKQNAAALAALAALHVGETEQVQRMPPFIAGKTPAPSLIKKTQVSVQFSTEGLLLLQKAQARLLERGIRRAGNKGTAIEIVLSEWMKEN